MNNLYTAVQIPAYPFDIDHEDQIMLLGSCFSNHIHQRLAEGQFNVLSNPFGITYNPISITQGLNQLMNLEEVKEQELVFRNECYHAFNFHSQYSGPSKTDVLAKMNNSIHTASLFLKNTNRLVITLGTANVFKKVRDGEVANNCHKFPGNHFEKTMLSVKDIVTTMQITFDKLLSKMPNLQILLTVSPIRHIRDGIMISQQSKATLLLATHELEKSNTNVHYFPSYEIMIDELRDYRFYKEDMIHPTDWSVDFIWKKFKTTFFKVQTMDLEKSISKIKIASKHRPYFPQSEAHQKFIASQIKEIEVLSNQHSFLDEKIMKQWFSSQ